MQDLILKSGVIIIKNNNLLLVRKKNKTFLLLPGGRIEKNETKKEALIREIKEELNVDIIPESIKFFGKFRDKAAHEKNTFVQIYAYFGKLKNIDDMNPHNEIVELVWFQPYENDKYLSPIIKNKIVPALLKVGFLKKS